MLSRREFSVALLIHQWGSQGQLVTVVVVLADTHFGRVPRSVTSATYIKMKISVEQYRQTIMVTSGWDDVQKLEERAARKQF